MSNLAHPDGDDFPAAAAKHLDDALALLAAGRSDGAGYLAGYTRECSLKTVIVLDAMAQRARLTPGTTLTASLRSPAPSDKTAVNAGLSEGHERARRLRHDLGRLSAEAQRLAAVPLGAVAKYAPRQSAAAPHGTLEAEGWRETIRYRAAGSIDKDKASRWLDDAKAVYLATVGAMRRDGVVFDG